MRFTRIEFVFVALGAALGVIVAFAYKAGWVAESAAFPPLIFVLLGLGLIEILVGYATARPLGSLVRTPARILAFAVGVGIMLMLGGKFA
jgi:hypothetical protein